MAMTTTDAVAAARRITRDELPALLLDLDRSGLSIAAFARSRGVRPSPLYRARQQLTQDAIPSPTTSPSKAADLIPIRVIDRGRASAASFTVEFASGTKLIVPPDFDAASLRSLLEVLGAC